MTAAEPKKTVLFNTPLYRKNLHYAVHPKPAAANESIAAMRDYILVHHKGEPGLVYCLTKKVRPLLLPARILASHNACRIVSLWLSRSAK